MQLLCKNVFFALIYYILSFVENSLHGGIQKRAVQELFASDKCTYSQKVLLSGAAVSDAAYKARHKARRQTQCTGETFGQNALKNAKPAGTIQLKNDGIKVTFACTVL